MKKRYLIPCLLGILTCSLVGCNNKKDNIENKDGVNKINIINVNDLHGAIMANDYSMGMDALKYQIDLIENRDNVKNTIVVGNGDMLQGTALSNMGYGESVINVMNEVGFDYIGLGNHEFDWGIEKFLKYFDGDISNGESTAKLINSNVYYKDSHELLPHSLPYSVMDLGFAKVGIVSFAPPELRYSILGKRTKNIDFKRLEYVAGDIINECKKECDIVVANIHSGSTRNEDFTMNDYNRLLVSLGVDAILDGHTHTRYQGYVIGSRVPVVQSRDSLKESFGLIELEVKDHKVVKSKASNVEIGDKKDAKITKAINEEYEKYKDIIEEELCYSKYDYYNRKNFPSWGSNLMLEVTNSDIALINNGAFRNINISRERPINYDQVYSMMPFDNEVIVFPLTGEEIKAISYNDACYALGGFNSIYDLDNATTYNIAIIDYVAYKYEELVKLIDNGVAKPYDILFRDMIVNEFREYGKHNEKFNVYNTHFYTSNRA